MARWLISVLALALPVSLVACNSTDDESLSGKQQGVDGEEGEEGGGEEGGGEEGGGEEGGGEEGGGEEGGGEEGGGEGSECGEDVGCADGLVCCEGTCAADCG